MITSVTTQQQHILLISAYNTQCIQWHNKLWTWSRHRESHVTRSGAKIFASFLADIAPRLVSSARCVYSLSQTAALPTFTWFLSISTRFQCLLVTTTNTVFSFHLTRDVIKSMLPKTKTTSSKTKCQEQKQHQDCTHISVNIIKAKRKHLTSFHVH